MSLFEELKRRNVFRVGIAYVLLGWVVMQAADFALDLVDAPNWIIQVFFIAGLVGLPFALFFAWAFELTPEGIKREEDVDRTASITPTTGRKLDRAIIAFLVLALLLLLGDRWLHSESSHAPEPATVAAEEPAAETEARSIAVLPFVNMSSDPEQEYFSDGISEEILNALAQVPDLKVAGRTSSFAFKGRNQDLRAIGEALGVNHILEGSVRKAGARVRITAQLVQTEDGFHLWSDTYDRELNDVFAIQDEIAGAILGELEAQLLGERAVRVEQVDLAVYDQYLLARQKMLERNEQSLTQAAELLEVVMAEDPGYAPAWALRGITELLLSNEFGMYGSVPLPVAAENAQRYLEQALELDPTLPDAHAGLGLLERNRGQPEAAEAALHTALRFNPNHVDALNWLQVLYNDSGRLREAWEMTARVHELDPFYVPGLMNYVMAETIQGHVDRATAAVDRVEPFLQGPALDYTRAIRLLATLMGSGNAAAVEFFEQAPSALPGIGSLLVYVSYLGLMEYEKALPYAEGTPLIALALSRLGRFEEASQRLVKMLEFGQGVTEYIQLLAEHGRYEELVRFVDARWPNLRDLAEQNRGTGFGSETLGYVAQAFRRQGDEARFREALALFKADLDNQFDEGADTPSLHWSLAHYRMLAGDADGAQDALETAVAKGYLAPGKVTRWWPVFEPLQAEPRFQALVERMDANRNAQRAQLGLPPIEADT